MRAMILAAGLGTRLRPFSLLRPKPLFPILGQPLLQRIIEQLRAAGFGPIIVNAYHLAGQMAAFLAGQPDIIVQREPVELGTGGGLRLALGHFAGEPVLVTNGDIYHDIDYGAVHARHAAGNCPVTMVMHHCPRFNTVRVRDGLVRGFAGSGPGGGDCLPLTQPAGQASGALAAFTGIHVLDPSLLRDIPPGVFHSIIDRYQAHLDGGGHIQALTVSGHQWTDIGTVADYLALHQRLLAAGGPPCRLAEGVSLGPRARLSDWGYVGRGASIGPDACLSRVVVWDGVVIPAGARHEDCLLAS